MTIRTALSAIVAPALVAALGLGAATPAMAHAPERGSYHDARDYRHDAQRHTPYRQADIRGEIARLRADIARAEARRTISWREAKGLRAELRQLESAHARFARNGLTGWEYRQLDRQADRLRLALRGERRDADRRRG